MIAKIKKMTNAIDLNKKLCYLLVTGASRGIGQKMAIEVTKTIKSGSVVVLLARSLTGLEGTKEEILKLNAVNVILKSIDLTEPKAEELHAIIKETFTIPAELAMIIHNVGTIGDVSKRAKQIECYEELQNYYSINVFGPIVLNTQFLKVVPAATKKLIVNITSKAGIVPFKSCAFYSSGKAGREMYFHVLAEEEKDNNVIVLNYAPGPIETNMTVDIQKNSCDKEFSDVFKNMRATKTILTVQQTTERFLAVVAEGKYNSGDHVDYYDE